MVKYGVGEILCLTCQSCIIVKTQVLRDKNWEMNILKKNCDHFTFSIDLYTKDTYLPLVKRDEIRFQLNAICNVCDKKDQCASACNSLNTVKSSTKQFTCHANTAQFKWGYWPNFWAEIYDIDKFENKFTLVRDNDYLKKLIFEESSEYIKERKQVKDHLREGIYLPSSNRWGELIRPDGTFNHPNEIEYKHENNGSMRSKSRHGSILVQNNTATNVYIEFSIEEMNKSLRYALGQLKKLLHAIVALVDLDSISAGDHPRTLYGWDSTSGTFVGDKKHFDNMALNRKFSSEKGYSENLVKIELVSFMTRKTSGSEIKYAYIQVKVDADNYGTVLLPCDISIGQHNIRNLMVESISNTSVVIVEPYSHKSGQVSHWMAAVLVKKLKKVLWYFKINET